LAIPSMIETWGDPDRRALTMATWIPLAGLIVAALVFKNVIMYRILSPMIAPLILWLSANLTPRKLNSIATYWAIPIMVILAVGVVIMPPSSGRNTSVYIAYIRDHWQAGDILYHATGTTALTWKYYLPGFPAYTLDEEQDISLLTIRVGSGFGLEYAPLTEIPHHRAWILWAHHPQLTDKTNARMLEIIRGAEWIGTIRIWQLAPIDIYLQEE